MERTESIERREFLYRAALGVAGASAGSLAAAPGPAVAAGAPAARVAASDKVNLALIGVGTRGGHLLPVFHGFPDVNLTVICDVRERERDAARAAAGGKPDVCADFRRVLERKDVDAVVVATNDHWHPIMAVEACKAGKDVYLEKPVSLSPGEGRFVVEAAKRFNRVVAIGTQQRSMAHYPKAVEYIRSGKLGKVAMVETFNVEHSRPARWGNPPDSEPPAGIDWDFWLGPAPKVPYNPARIAAHHHFWDTGGGWQCDWAVHHNDIVHWALDVKGPLSVAAAGGKYHITDCTEMPDTLEFTFEYPGFLLAYKLRWSNARRLEGLAYGDIFYGSEGTMVLNREGWRVFLDTETKPAAESPGTPEDGPHQRDFIECVKSRAKPAADAETGHRSSIPGEIGNIAFRVGRKLRWDVEKEEFIGDAEANRWLMKPYRSPWRLKL